MKENNLIGKKFGKLTAVANGKRNNGKYYVCKCDCGNIKEIYGGSLINGSTKSCGCLWEETNREWIENHTKYTNKQKDIYEIWTGMKQRCYNPRAFGYEYYGGKGVGVCKRWKDSFDNFYKDMGPRPSNKHSIDRIDNNTDYSPNNCRWANSKEQSRNKESNVILELNGERKTLTDWAKELNIKRHTLYSRKRRGLSDKEILTAVHREKKYPYNGKQLTLKEWSKEAGINLRLLRNRIYSQKWSIEKALGTKKRGYSNGKV